MQRTVRFLSESGKNSSDNPALLRAVCEDVAEQIGVNRVSIWHFQDHKTAIHCDCYFMADKNDFSEGQILYASDAPLYFETILEEQYIVAPDARNQPETAELTKTYFEPNDIYSLLDFIVHKNFSPVGIICCENAYRRRDWTQDDKSYLLQISTLFSFI